MVPAGPRRLKVTESSISVGFGFTWMVVAPASIARSVKEAAPRNVGWWLPATLKWIPITQSRSRDHRLRDVTSFDPESITV